MRRRWSSPRGLRRLPVLGTGAHAGARGGAAARGGGPDSLNVLMVNNPQMVDLQKLTADNFTKQTGIRVNFTVLPENDVRDKISQEFSSQAGQYDVATVSNFEIPIYARSKWIAPLDGYIAADPKFDQADILPPMVKSLSGAGRQGLRRAVLRRVVVPDVPQGRAGRQGHHDAGQPDLAAGGRHRRRRSTAPSPGWPGICLRGQPGWGQVFAPLTTVVNTFGGTWFTKDWHAQVNAPRVPGRRRSSTSTWSATTGRTAHRRPGSPSA